MFKQLSFNHWSLDSIFPQAEEKVNKLDLASHTLSLTLSHTQALSLSHTYSVSHTLSHIHTLSLTHTLFLSSTHTCISLLLASNSRKSTDSF